MRHCRRAVIFGLVGMSLLGATGCTSSGKPSGKAVSATPEESTISGSAAPDGGTIRVVESGFTISSDLARRLSLAVMVENTSKARPGTGTVKVRFLDPDGNTITYRQKEELSLDLGLIRPGERAAATEYELGTDFRGKFPIARIEARVDGIEWRARSKAGQGEVTDIKITKDATGTWTASFTASFTPPKANPTDTAPLVMVFRSSEGKILGGLRSKDDPIAPGRAEQHTGLGDPSKGWIPFDPVKTEFLLELRR